LQRKSERLLTSFDKLFSDYNPQPALLHGDLWSGNYAMDRNGQAIIFVLPSIMALGKPI
jgi:protein-ribulosamine 3-kinase